MTRIHKTDLAMYTRVECCRACGNKHLEQVLDLGKQVLTGVFPRVADSSITSGPLCLVKCNATNGCGLLQLQHSYDLGEMYGDNYGYRSGLNPNMVAHLHTKVARIRAMIDLQLGDLVLDIGSNDGTTLRAYPDDLTLVGIDPTSAKFQAYFPEHAHLIADFFSAARVAEAFAGRKARVITSFSMFYDLEDPLGFMREVHDILADDGVWVFEQSYMPAMLEANAFDTVCHEHLEFYALEQIQWMASRAGLRLIDVEFNDVNGGSFSVTAMKASGGEAPLPAIQAILDRERALGLHTLEPYEAFARRVAESRAALRVFMQAVSASGKTVAALGASTKGNVLLQYCGFGSDDIMAVGEVNPDKIGCVTPGTWLPIVSEDRLLASAPDYLLVLPWHFRSFFIANPKFSGRALVFPLPQLEIVPPRR